MARFFRFCGTAGICAFSFVLRIHIDQMYVFFNNIHFLSDNLDEAYKWMYRIDKFEQKHLRLRSEYRVIGDLINRLKESSGKEKFLLQLKLNRAMRLINYKEAFDPNNPANFGLIRQEEGESAADHLQQAGFQRIQRLDDDSEEEFDDMKEKDDILLEQLSAIDKKLEEKLAELDHTFGRKGKVLEEEIRDLAEERNSLTEKKKRPLYRKVRIFSSFFLSGQCQESGLCPCPQVMFMLNLHSISFALSRFLMFLSSH